MDNFLIIFDNYTFKLNNVVYNFIKRFVLYEIINKKYIENKYNDVILFKTNPQLTTTKLNKSNSFEDISDIMLNINNIIYKEYETYPTMLFKNIFNKIKDIETNVSDKNTILIITSINNEYNFTNTNIDYLNNIINTLKSNIKIINISNNRFLNELFPKLDEFFIDIKNFKIENIIIKEIFNLETYPNDDEIFTKYKNISENNNSIEVNNSIELFEYICLLCFIEKNILINLDNKLTNIKNMIGEFNKMLRFQIITNNNLILNLLKCFQNSISNILQRNYDLCVNIPIDKLSDELANSYIKYILEFYQIIYPKIYKYTNSIASANTSKKNKSTNTSLIVYKNFTKLEFNDISSQFLNSTLTLTNWVEEYNNLNPFGFLIQYSPNKYSYKGILDINSSILKTYPNMIIGNVSTNMVSVYDYYQIILSEFESIPDDFVNTNKEIFNISNFNIIDNISGDGNVLLPVYINKKHWELTKTIWSYHLSFINNCFEFEYNKKMDNLYLYTLLKLFNDLKNINQNQNIKTIIRLFAYLLRTCLQILIDNNFLHSVKNNYQKYFNLLLTTESFEKNCNFSDWIIRLIQMIVSNQYEHDNLSKDLDLVTSNIFNKFVISNYKIDFWERINDEQIDTHLRHEELEMLKTNTIQKNICWLYMEHDLKIFNNIIRSIYSIKGFNQFIKIIDQTNGCLEDNNIPDTINLHTIKNIIVDKCSEQFDLTKYSVDISKYYKFENI